MKTRSPHDPAYLAAPLSALLFAASLVLFAAIRTDGYSHATKAVSELGSIDAPNAIAFNLLGFILPGLLIVTFALRIATATGRRIGPGLLALSGALLSLAGLARADLDNPQSIPSILHIVGAIGSGVAWAVALFPLGRLLVRSGMDGWGRLTPWFGMFLFANVGWQILYQSTGTVLPGWGQRIAFFGYFLWLAITGYLLWRGGPLPRADDWDSAGRWRKPRRP